ncbi:peptidylprolyl isomerase [Pleionea litopenaei]|uniref:Peptidylprolyl isomerase n=1 Tax=Pleionea litopenaei TaxID=3070815 RepID=A0AA51RRK1_9GAMM|nr:peptidylprolyl isomerase [Pleionea sp. HL-JVS1]WMS86240.1 peptidylprolyl isomerase [Pleionea sp. HL-JVS1]
MKNVLLLLASSLICSGCFATALSGIVLPQESTTQQQWSISGELFDYFYNKFGKPYDLSPKKFATLWGDSISIYQFTKLTHPDALKRNAVDYSEQWYFEQFLVSYYRSINPTQETTTFESVLRSIEQRQLEKLFKHQSTLGYELTKVQRRQLDKIQVYQDTAFKHLDFSLTDLFDRLSIQDKQKLLKQDRATLLREVELKLIAFKAQQFLQPKKIFTSLELGYKSLLFSPRIKHFYGVTLEQHSDGPKLKQWRDSVSAKDIERYYKKNKNEFSYIRQASVYYQTLPTLQQARRVAKQWQKHLPQKDPEKIDKNFSDKWLSSVALSLPPKTISQPIRSPQGTWLVVYVLNQDFAIYPLDSETVRYAAKRHLGQEKAKSYYNQLLKEQRETQGIAIDE